MYKIVPMSVFDADYKATHPTARVSPDGKEVVLSNEGDMTQAEVKKYILDNWPQDNSELP